MANIARHVIERCGGFDRVAEICGVHASRVYRWTYEPDRGGTGGLIPARHQAKLLRAAKTYGFELGPEDFFDLRPAVANLERSGASNG